jgi:hypothetical protein
MACFHHGTRSKSREEILPAATFIRFAPSNIARHVLQNINDSQDHTISLDQLTLIKEVRKPSELDAYESFYISRRKKEGANLMNVAAGRISSRLFELVPWWKQAMKKLFSVWKKIFPKMAA